LLGFSVADIMDLSSGGGGEGHIKITLSSSVLFLLGEPLV